MKNLIILPVLILFACTHSSRSQNMGEASAERDICSLMEHLDSSATEYIANHAKILIEDINTNGEVEDCFFALMDSVVSKALENNNSMEEYGVVDAFAKISDGFVSEGMGVSILKMYENDREDFEAYVSSNPESVLMKFVEWEIELRDTDGGK